MFDDGQGARGHPGEPICSESTWFLVVCRRSPFVVLQLTLNILLQMQRNCCCKRGQTEKKHFLRGGKRNTSTKPFRGGGSTKMRPHATVLHKFFATFSQFIQVARTCKSGGAILEHPRSGHPVEVYLPKPCDQNSRMPAGGLGSLRVQDKYASLFSALNLCSVVPSNMFVWSMR